MRQTSATCALRALTLCDGHRLEESQGALTQCPCEVLADATRYEAHELAERLLQRSLEAVTPQLPL